MQGIQLSRSGSWFTDKRDQASWSTGQVIALFELQCLFIGNRIVCTTLSWSENCRDNIVFESFVINEVISMSHYSVSRISMGRLTCEHISTH